LENISLHSSRTLNSNENNNTENIQTNSKRLIHNLSNVKSNNQHSSEGWKSEKKIIDENEFRKTIKKEKIEIDCDTSNKQKIDDELLDTGYINNLSKEKKKFFLFKVREVYDFLTSIKLVRYIERFIEDGLEDLECILGNNII
jgi:hypothetical protein